MESDVSTDPSDYTDYSDCDSDYTSISLTDRIKHINSDKKLNDKNKTMQKTDFDNKNMIDINSYSIININKSIDAVLSSLSINNNNNNKKTYNEESSNEYSDNDSSSYYSSESSSSYYNNNNNKNKNKKMRKYSKKQYMDNLECLECDDMFISHKSFRKHMNETHNILQPFICIKCENDGINKQYADISGLRIHIERDHEMIRNYECNICSKQYYDKQSYKYHLKSHKNNTLHQQIPCKQCNDKFESHPKYRKHMNEIHKIEYGYICNKCPKDKAAKYKTKGGLDKHIGRDHEKQRRFKCKLCTKKFYEKKTLENHQRVHDGLKPFKCSYCKLRFSLKHSLKQHIIVIHLKEKRYQCQYCGTKFPSLSGMKSHAVSQHNDDKYARFECKICHKRFYEKGWYFKHIDNVHRPKDPKKEMIKKGECFYAGCNKKYTSKNCAESVKYHLVAVHKDREYAKYECKKCRKLFYDKTSHTDHMKSKHKKMRKY